MSQAKTKICGITNLADARYAAGAGADYLGFIQAEHSPRYVEPSMARDIIEWVHGPENVGVFVDEDPAVVNEVAALAGFDLVQLHGNESPEDCAACDRPVIKAIHVGASGPSAASTAEELLEAAHRYAGAADYLLLDTARSASGAGAPASGGTGATFDWSMIPELPLPFFLAGGLTPANVATAAATPGVFGVDVSGGVEEAPGQKDFERIDAFIDAVRTA